MSNRDDSRDYVVLSLAAAATSIASFLYFYFQHEILLYGDAVAHINIARRVFDSRTPGPLQGGTVWLPLPHILTIPFVISGWMWQTGVGGSVVSMVAFVWATVGIFRLVRSGTRQPAAAWLAVLIFAANPNLLYMQSTAMTEGLFVALSVWAIVYTAEFARELGSASQSTEAGRIFRKLELSALCLSGAMLTRYDGWFLAIFVSIFVLGLSWRHRKSASLVVSHQVKRRLRNFVLLTLAAPILWFAYNYGVYQNALEFANGPYSARAIAYRSANQGSPMHPGYRDVRTAAVYYAMSAKLNLGDRTWQRAIIWLAIFGSLLLALFGKGLRIWFLLWIPLLFYSASIAYGGVPIFIPVWWPFSYYNVRYGLEMLPAIAVFIAAAWDIVSGWISNRVRPASYTVVLVLFAMVYALNWKDTPVCLREARVNSVTRVAFEAKLAEELSKLPHSSSLLMYTANHVGALQQAGIHLKRTINEGNYPIWGAALADPARWADYVVTMKGDPVWQSAQQHLSELAAIATVTVPGQPQAVIYRTRTATSH